MTDRYYIDYRIGEIVKNLDTAFMAPELYNEVIVDNDLDGIFKYTYEDKQGRKLAFSFTMESIGGNFYASLDAHCKINDFERHQLIDKCVYISQDKFEQGYSE